MLARAFWGFRHSTAMLLGVAGSDRSWFPPWLLTGNATPTSKNTQAQSTASMRNHMHSPNKPFRLHLVRYGRRQKNEIFMLPHSNPMTLFLRSVINGGLRCNVFDWSSVFHWVDYHFSIHTSLCFADYLNWTPVLHWGKFNFLQVFNNKKAKEVNILIYFTSLMLLNGMCA